LLLSSHEKDNVNEELFKGGKKKKLQKTQTKIKK